MSVPPQTYGELRIELQGRMDSLAAGQRRIAQVLLADPEGTAFRTIAETAALASVHQSSLVRFAAMIGLSGYPALVKLCREQLAESAQLVRRFQDTEQDAESGELLNAVVEHDQQNLARTFARIEQAEWDQVVALLAGAAQVHVIGLRRCLMVAELMAYLLRLARPGVHLVAPITSGLADELRELHTDDVFVAISIRRYAADTVRALRHAKQQGLSTIALTDDPASPLAQAADITFYVETAGVTTLRSLSAFVSLVQALSTAVALHNDACGRDELPQDEALLQAFDVYVDPESTPPGL